MRHLPFSIGLTESQRWQQLMSEAMDEIEVDSEAKELISTFFARVADFMCNRRD